jgi:hypothetical protein
MPSAQIIRASIIEDGSATYLARVRNDAGTLITQASVTSIACKVFNLRTGTLISSPAVVVASSIFDTLQTDARWTVDTTGYNFRHTVGPSVFTSPNVIYRVEYFVTPVTGDVFPLSPAEVTTIGVFSS